MKMLPEYIEKAKITSLSSSHHAVKKWCQQVRQCRWEAFLLGRLMNVSLAGEDFTQLKKLQEELRYFMNRELWNLEKELLDFKVDDLVTT